MAVTDDKIAATAARYRKRLDKRPQAPESLAQAPDSELRVIVAATGAKRKSPALLEKLEAAFSAAGIVTFPAITDPFLKNTDRVRMFDANQPVDGLAEQRYLFPKEDDLQSFIWARRTYIREFRGLTSFTQQALLDSGRRVDMMCRRAATNQLVAIELKAAQPDDRSVGQVQKYLTDLALHAENHGFDSAHLIVIAGQPDRSARERIERYAAACDLTVEFLLYRVETKLVPHP